MLAHARDLPEEVADPGHRNDPEQSPEDGEGEEALVVHLPHSGDDRGEGPDDRHEARDDDRLAAMFLVEVVGAPEMGRVEEE